MSVYESLCLRSPISATRARPGCTRVRGQIASDHWRSDLITGCTHWARAGYPFPEVNLPETPSIWRYILLSKENWTPGVANCISFRMCLPSQTAMSFIFTNAGTAKAGMWVELCNASRTESNNMCKTHGEHN